MKVHQMKALSQLGFLRTPFQNASQQSARPALVEETTGNFRKVPSQLLFDLELEDACERQQSSRPASPAIHKLEHIMLPFSEAQMQLLRDAEQGWRKIASQTQGSGASALADALRQLGYEARPRMAIGGGGGAACLQNLCHRYVSCSIQDAGAMVSYVVDPHFREQFEIARPTASYKGLLEAIPDVVVLAEEQVPHLVQLLCHELGDCFKQVGETIPPWRRPASMASKWQPRRSLDGGVVSMTADSALQPSAAHLARASAVPVIGELSKRLPSSKRIEIRASSDMPSEHVTPNQTSQSLQPVSPMQHETYESIVGGANLMPDMRRLLAFY